jgi:ubiquitin C-terminal hydrolase
MRKYTLEGVEAIDAANSKNIIVSSSNGDAVMDTLDPVDHSASPKDEDYEYNLVGVLVHAGVAQGGHYYSYIKDHSLSENEAADK